MKNLIIYASVAFCIAVMYLSTSRHSMQYISDRRNEHDEWWGVHFPVEGDLIGMSYLYLEKKFARDGPYHFPAAKCSNSINLVLWGDSYTEFIPDSAFCASSYTYGRRYFSTLKYRIAADRKNILLIELTERSVREYFASTRMSDEVVDTTANKRMAISWKQSSAVNHFSSFEIPEIEDLYNPFINQNLEYNLFNYNFINPIREAKAWMNYHVFRRASGYVMVSDDNQYLFYGETIDKKQQGSSFASIPDDEVNKIVDNLNAINEHYRAAGFDDVYLAIIPNPVTILQPEGYNQLIPRIQKDAALKMPVIDIYTTFQHTKEQVYLRGDTHWNNRGVNLWVQQVNKLLQQL